MLYLPVVLLDGGEVGGGILDVLLGSGTVHLGGVGRHHRFVLGVTVEITRSPGNLDVHRMVAQNRFARRRGLYQHLQLKRIVD